MFSFLLYYIALIRLKYFSGSKKSRFSYCDPKADVNDVEKGGYIWNDKIWRLGTPNIDKNVNFQFITTNTFDKTSFKLSLKWRPDNSE